ncbi:MAG: hypothetical protein IPK60_19405 [Sandaracinaceae bacterium]|jgi:hypothetical protein|nr:hypothetical protein [Sandaracinaceae bacterium]
MLLATANSEADDMFSGFTRAIALSSDGATLMCGAPREDSNALGINGDGSNKASSNSGAVYMFTR